MMEQASSSKVTVEYYDPNNVYQLLSPGLLPRLPLRNLHWESHAGPLRSVRTLHVDLVPAAGSDHSTSTSNNELAKVQSNEAAGVDDGFRVQPVGAAATDRPISRAGKSATVKERRHQIPGLRRTPYLKIFFLRCDDNDSYKASARKQVREWMKEHIASSSTTKANSQENHDAYEWLIVHVVVPNTAAATQPRTATKGSTPILEKLKADFNSTSKHAVDRIAQIRIGVNDVPYDLLPRVVPAIPGSYFETPQEHQDAWADLVTKLKSLILSSFDMRVSQYEEDIKEKDSQRTLPGWNFCTFFVLKEGLARGFESVGLVEDALVGYDELSAGLDTIIGDQSRASFGSEHGGSFLRYTPELKTLVETSKAAIERESGAGVDNDEEISLQDPISRGRDEILLSATRKPYRDLVLANDISVFDFRCYVFARQLSLLLRLANASCSKDELLAKLREQRESNMQGLAARNPPPQDSEDVENLTILGEVCKRALQFISSITRIMREDIEASQDAAHQNQNQAQTESSHGLTQATAQAMNNIVASFTFSITQQILAQTATKSLPIPPSTLVPPGDTPGLEQKAAIPEPKTMMHPARSASLMTAPSLNIHQGGTSELTSVRSSSVQDSNAGTSKSSHFLKAGLEELAAHRAELYLLSRGVLERLGSTRNWSVGWTEISEPVEGDTMEDISLSENDAKIHAPKSIPRPSRHGLSNGLLEVALSNQDDYYRLYEILTDKALRHYTVASHTQSVQASMADLAVLKFHLKDYAAAASYFYRMTPFYGEGGWTQIEMKMLAMYAMCLKELKRNEEYVRVALKLLAKAATREKDRLSRMSTVSLSKRASFVLQDFGTVDGYLTDLLAVVKDLQHDINVPLQAFFASILLESAARYSENVDTYALTIKLRYLLSDELTIDKLRVQLLPVRGGQSKEIWLDSTDTVLCQKGLVSVRVESNVNIPGIYAVKQVVLHASKMVMSYDVDSDAPPVRSTASKFLQTLPISLYSRPKSLDVRLSASRSIHLAKTRTFELIISSGWNHVESGELHLRAATAGLRVLTSECSHMSGDAVLLKNAEPGVIKFTSMGANQHVRLLLPFTLENESPDLNLKVELSYTTEAGTFFFANQLSQNITLPLGVNVQDVFKDKHLFSKFSITTATPSPLRILSSRLEGSDMFEASRGFDLSRPVTVFPKQPATLLYKVTKKTSPSCPSTESSGSSETSKLTLVVSYTRIDEETDEAIRTELERALSGTAFEEYAKLLTAAVCMELSVRMVPVDFERTALLNGVSTATLANVRWIDQLAGLGKDFKTGRPVATLLSNWLDDWQARTPIVSLLPSLVDENSITNSRSISIPVDIPPVTVVHTADIALQQAPIVSTGEIVATINQPLSAVLHIKSTRAWDSTPSGATSEGSTLDFVYELTAAQDKWLIGGKRKGHFSLPASQDAIVDTLSFPILLIPIKEGYLPYPSFDIRSVVKSRPKSRGASQEAVDESPADAITCETDYKNVAETIKVISNARKTTVSLDASGPQGGAWLLESIQRDIGDRDLLVK